MQKRDLKRIRDEAVADLRAQPPVVIQMLLALFEAEVEVLKETMMAPAAQAEDIALSRAAALALRNLSTELTRRPVDHAQRRSETHNLDPIAGI